MIVRNIEFWVKSVCVHDILWLWSKCIKFHFDNEIRNVGNIQFYLKLRQTSLYWESKHFIWCHLADERINRLHFRWRRKMYSCINYQQLEHIIHLFPLKLNQFSPAQSESYIFIYLSFINCWRNIKAKSKKSISFLQHSNII